MEALLPGAGCSEKTEAGGPAECGDLRELPGGSKIPSGTSEGCIKGGVARPELKEAGAPCSTGAS